MKQIIAEVTQFMRDHTERDVSIEELADRFGYSKFHFSREFKKLIGVTPNEYWAALKMEKSLAALERSSILSAHLRTGYQSTGTFTSSFQRATGFTPGQYQEEIHQLNLLQEAKEYEGVGDKVYTHYSFNRKDPSTLQTHVLHVTCHLPEDFKGLIFVGLFRKPLPTDAPVLGKAMTRTNRCVIDQIPDGEYYALACAMRSSMNPLSYFRPDLWLRDLHRVAYYFPLAEDTAIEFVLREKVPTDPAIPCNPMKLLVEAMKRKD